MGIIDQIFALKALGGLGLLIPLLWGYRVIMLYCKETRENYRDRLTATVLELEEQKTINIRLELRIQTMEFLQSMREGKANQPI
jgi:hypothetical protein